MGGPPKPGSVWWVNIDRQRHTGGQLQLMSWSPTGSNFHDPLRFAALVFDDKYAGHLDRAILSPWDERAAALRERAKIDPEAAGRLEQELLTIDEQLAPLRAAVKGQAPPSLQRLGALLEVGQDAVRRLEEAKGYLDGTIARREVAQQMRKLARPGQQLLAYSVRAITNRQILPIPRVPEVVSDTLSLRACRGEYEPASFVVYPLENSVRLQVRVSDLTGPAGTIPAKAVDIRAVKCWYQSGKSGRFPINKQLRALTPELLLRDDGLVRVDYENRENFVKLRYPDGRQRWLWVSSPETTPEEKRLWSSQTPIRDADTLQPVQIPAHEAKQLWVTVKVPDDAQPGLYEGKIQLWSISKHLETMKVKLQVLPFDLAPNPLESSIYFHWGITIDQGGVGTVQHRTRSWAQYRAELENLVAHGVDNPTLGIHFNTGLLSTALKMRREVGMRMDHLYYLIQGAHTPAEEMKQIIQTAREYGYEDVYFYGRDEARGDALRRQRAVWQKTHENGGKVFVAGSAGHNFPDMGDLQDLLVCYGDPTAEEAALWHSKGHKIFCYANPQSGIEEPETYRRNFGLLLYVNDYDGGMTYIYYHGWNDYSGARYRQHNFVYPTVNGLIDTVQWEGYREGIDDLRYVGTLLQAIDAAQKAGGARATQATQAQAFLDKMDVDGDLYALRGAIVDQIIKLAAPSR